jgi:hypothetical protein
MSYCKHGTGLSGGKRHCVPCAIEKQTEELIKKMNELWTVKIPKTTDRVLDEKELEEIDKWARSKTEDVLIRKSMIMKILDEVENSYENYLALTKVPIVNVIEEIRKKIEGLG